MTPIILLYGEAGAGKDSVATAITKAVARVQPLALADPMKQFALQVFGFTEEALWGPSAARNVVEPRFTYSNPGYGEPDKMSTALWDAFWKIEGVEGRRWLLNINAPPDSMESLKTWFASLKHYAKENNGLSARTVLQTLGTEFGRSVDRKIWINAALATAEKLLEGGYRYDRVLGLTEDQSARTDLVVVTDGRFKNELLTFKARGATTIQVYDPLQAVQPLAGGVTGHASEKDQKEIPAFWFDYRFFNRKVDGLDNLTFRVAQMMTVIKDQTRPA